MAISNQPTNVLRGTVGVLVTLTNANTNYNLYDLVNAVVAAEGGAAVGTIVTGSCRQIVIQSYPGLAGAGANTAEVLLGDGSLSTTRMGAVLPVGANWSDRSSRNNVTWSDIYARSATAGQKLAILITLG